jgi:hypothetical protein
MKENYLNENIRSILDGLLIYLCSKYDIYKPDIYFDAKYDSAHYNFLKNKIVLGEIAISSNSFKEDIEPYISIKILTKFGEIIFNFLHEFGHCVQYNKYPKMWNIYSKQYIKHIEKIKGKFITPELYKIYRELKVEKFADKFAIHYMKKHYSEHIKCN